MANFKENKKYHYTYKTTNLTNGRYYLGMHSTNRLNDGYLGSGKRLYYEVSKYGRENFKFEILEQFDSREELVQAEANLITEEDIKNPNCLNLKPGGSGGLSSNEHKEKWNKAGLTTIGNLYKTNLEFKNKMSGIRKEEMKRQYEEGERVRKVNYNWNGKHHRPEVVEKMKGHTRQQGEKNSQYGRPRSEETKQKIRESLRKTRESKKFGE